MGYARFAFDRVSSARTFDIDGRLRVRLAVLSQARVDRYLGSEIVDDPGNFGLDPEAEYLIYRPPQELRRAVPSVNGLPILTSHEPVDAIEFRPDLLCGATLNDARFEAPFLKCSIAIWSAEAIKKIESGERSALSLGYRWEPDMKPGVTPEGVFFDGSMRSILCNHLALCAVPRIGAFGYIADARPRRLDEKFRNFRKRFVGVS